MDFWQVYRQWRARAVAGVSVVLASAVGAQALPPATPGAVAPGAPAPAATAAAPMPAAGPAINTTAAAADGESAPKGCLVAHFKALSLGQNDVQRRVAEAKVWLRRNVDLCTAAQLTSIRGNSAAWLGTALTQEIASFIEGAVEVKALGDPQLMAELYDSFGKDAKAGVNVIRSGTPRPPVQQPVIVLANDRSAAAPPPISAPVGGNATTPPSPGATASPASP